MNISRFLQYKVIESEQHLSVIPAARVVQGAIELIIADMPTCGEYLARYTHERADGKAPKEAHQAALRGARVLQKGHFDRAAEAKPNGQ